MKSKHILVPLGNLILTALFFSIEKMDGVPATVEVFTILIAAPGIFIISPIIIPCFFGYKTGDKIIAFLTGLLPILVVYNLFYMLSGEPLSLVFFLFIFLLGTLSGLVGYFAATKRTDLIFLAVICFYYLLFYGLVYEK